MEEVASRFCSSFVSSSCTTIAREILAVTLARGGALDDIASCSGSISESESDSEAEAKSNGTSAVCGLGGRGIGILGAPTAFAMPPLPRPLPRPRASPPRMAPLPPLLS